MKPFSTIASSLLFWLTLSSGIAFLWPAESIGWDPFRADKYLIWSLIVVTMFCLGMLVRPQELGPLRKHPWWVALGVAAQITIMPAAAWLVTQVVPMDAQLAAGVILVGCVPGAMASNVLTHTAGGSVAYSVSLTTVATLLSPITVPTVLAIVAGANAKSSADTAILLTGLVALPTIAGYLAAQGSKRLREWSDAWAGKIASVALLWIIAGVVAKTRDQLLEVSALLILALLLMNLIGYLAGFLVGKSAGLASVYSRALSLEVGMQNAGLGTALAATLYGKDTLATIPTAAYTFGCMLTGTLLASGWRWLDKNSRHIRQATVQAGVDEEPQS